MPSVIRTMSAAATHAVGTTLAPLLNAGDVLLLSGDLGAGKTALTQGVAEGLGIPEPVTSPTFNILVVHRGRIPLYHFDLYRLEHSEQLEDVAYWETLEADGVSIVEWGDRFPDALPAAHLDVTIAIEGDNERLMSVSSEGARASELASRWLEACGGLAGVETGGRA